MTQPLQGVRITDLTQVLAGPFATRQLADLGAEVIKIEQPGAGDPTRSWGPHFLNGHSAYFLGINRNKKSVTLNLRHPKGQEVLHKLVATSDAVVDNYRPATAKRLGITHEALRAFNPRIITCSLSGFGDAPGYESKPAFDSIVQAMGGAMSVTGEPGGAPAVMGFPLGDLGGGLALSQAVLAALYARSQTGQAQRAELSMLDMQVQFQAHLGQFHLVSGEEPGPIGNSHPHNAPVRAFLCRDGRYIQVHCPTDPSYRALATALAEELGGEFASLASDHRFSSPAERSKNKGPLYDLLERAFIERDSSEWLPALDAKGAPSARVNTLGEAIAEPSVQARNMVVEAVHPEAGTYRSAGNPLKFEGASDRFDPAPLLGQHTQEVLGALGYTQDSIDALREEGAV